jgi:hypothetical protein
MDYNMPRVVFVVFTIINKIFAIKTFREVFALGLKEAKDAIEAAEKAPFGLTEAQLGALYVHLLANPTVRDLTITSASYELPQVKTLDYIVAEAEERNRLFIPSNGDSSFYAQEPF